MFIEALLIVSAFFAGRWTAPQEISTVQVKVEVPVECRVDMPVRPVMPTEQLAAKPQRPDVAQYTRAAIAEIKRREGYELVLRANLEKCTAPINPQEPR